jgi:hypothetical protein
MTAGSLFWLRQAYDLSFSTTWPVLIIVFGVMKLLEAMAPRMESHEQRPYGGGLS